VTEEPRGTGSRPAQGKELSFNNLLDMDAAMWAVSCWSTRVACCIVKHTTPCGIALGTTRRKRSSVRGPATVSAFGGIVAFNTVVTREAALAMKDLFLEVIVAPSFHDDAMQVLAAKKNLRVIELPISTGIGTLDFKRVRGGFLVQDRLVLDPDETGWTVPTERAPSDPEWDALRFAWPAIASVKSNAILLARGEQAIGIGAGQMSRVDSVFVAIHKARQAGHDPAGSVLASDGFFPCRQHQLRRRRHHGDHPARRFGARPEVIAAPTSSALPW
jgi:phosphoribosylaminoimidazolecarboxamide formyltransferase/IMP cyclohydrolase